MATGEQNTFGPRRRFKGKMARVEKRFGRLVIVPRSSERNHTPARITRERGQPRATQTKHIPGACKVTLPRGWIRGWV